ncbi:DNA-binding response regulator [Neisseria sp. N95_16]|uniref:Response regulator n=1 Tax=Neisseria brasiliensis TaxID=2666100 RepID=A0A5Q3S553_9NEIS|nr:MULTISPECIES: response regulator transcription factor [Neisseria]MRN37347.1 response regulator [Neisseria brasiliensis]PJO08753.1 DNA-binding response regulator [Neisseria sp. N95_16]PJO77755.1 DNA-binding response regulator [Neisseria sp. N177_16]QGL25658.1 response regulator [Neisseria brasiliensis]
MSTSIVLIDDHTLFRRGIKSVLGEADFEIIGEAEDGLSGVKLVEQVHPDVVLLDLDMPVMNGREALGQILSSNPSQKVVMLTVSEDSDDLIECMKLGAQGFLLKNIDADFLINAIVKAANGDSVFSPEMTAHLVQSLINPAQENTPNALKSLTPRELETLKYLAIGHSNKVIARQLNLAESTIKAYVQSILKKLNLSSRVQAAVYAIQHNLISEADK